MEKDIGKIKKVEKIIIKDLRCNHINKNICLEGYLIRASDIRPEVSSAKFKCPDCKKIIFVTPEGTKFKEPSKCSCGRKKHFYLISKIMFDSQRLVIAEKKDVDENGFAKSHQISVFIDEKLTDPKYKIFDKIGKKIRIFGTLRERPVFLASGELSRRFDLVLEANDMIFL